MGRKRKNVELEAPKMEEEKVIGEVPPLSEKEIEEHDRLDREYFDTLPPGYRFNPTSEELVEYYLKKKVSNSLDMPLNRIRVANIYAFSPEYLTRWYKLHREKEWYFFSSRTKKYPNGKRPNRSAGKGFWKATGADVDIADDEGIIIGTRKTLVYHRGKAKEKNAIKTNWIMHEYRHKVNSLDSVAGPVIERLKTKANNMKEQEAVAKTIASSSTVAPSLSAFQIYCKKPGEQVPNLNPNEAAVDNATNSPTPASSLVQNQQAPNFNPRHSSTHDIMRIGPANYRHLPNQNTNGSGFENIAANFPRQNEVGHVPFRNQIGIGFGNSSDSFRPIQNGHLPNLISEPGLDDECFQNRGRFPMPASSPGHEIFPWSASSPRITSFAQNQQVPNPNTSHGTDFGNWLNTLTNDELTSTTNQLQSLPNGQSFPPSNLQAKGTWDMIIPAIDLENSLDNYTHSQFAAQEPDDLENSLASDTHSQFTVQEPDEVLRYLNDSELECNQGQLPNLDDTIKNRAQVNSKENMGR